jgi:membrane glycosyltransferase
MGDMPSIWIAAIMNQSVPPSALTENVEIYEQDALRTPAGFQNVETLKRRRIGVAVLNLMTNLLWLGALGFALAQDGWGFLDIVVMLGALMALPWSVLGFWNAILGLWLLHGYQKSGRQRGLMQTAPFWAAADIAIPLIDKTAILMTLRNEDPVRALRRMAIVKESLERTGEGASFSYFVLSDTSDPAIAACEEEEVRVWCENTGDAGRIHYRRRANNEGFKAGNLRDFCARWGHDYTFMIPLDADSLMTGPAILRLVRIMQSAPRLGILQSLAVGAPATSGFARLFQFGMRQGMRPYTMGASWWTGDCGPFWGHNAVVRIKPFIEHCALPLLSGKAILSHDQIEAALMRKAGFEVRVLPIEDGSYEDNPPSLIAFSRRDLRWCQGNLQYGPLLALEGLKPLSRFQLLWAMLMFIGIPAMTGLIVLSPLVALAMGPEVPFSLLAWLYGVFLLMFLAPKLAGLCDILLTKGQAACYGGVWRVLISSMMEIIFSFLLGAITTFRLTLFMMGLMFRQKIVWDAQERDAQNLTWGEATRFALAPTLFGVSLCTSLYAVSPVVLLWSLPLTLGYLVAIPFTWMTASQGFGTFLQRYRLAVIPEEMSHVWELEAVRCENKTI